MKLTGTANLRKASTLDWAELIGVHSVSPGEVMPYEQNFSNDQLVRLHDQL